MTDYNNNNGTRKREIVFQGIAASYGVAIGTALVIKPKTIDFNISEKNISEDELPKELERFNKAIDRTREQLTDLQKKLQMKLDEKESRIFDAHLMIVDDKMLIDEVIGTIKRERKNAESVFYKIISRYIKAISTMPDKYIRERAADIEDVSKRILSNLSKTEETLFLDKLPGQRVLIAYDLTPSDTAMIDRDNVLGFVTETGSFTSHTAILARSMKIPAIVGIRNIFNFVQSEDLVIIDGYVGTFIVNPTEHTLEVYAQKETKEERYYLELLKESRLRPETIDGFRIQLTANIENQHDIPDVKRYGAAGIGLFRTEYLFMNVQSMPDEEEQFAIYKRVAADMNGQQVVIRTLDLGGDKLSDMFISHHEPNPFLGFRAIRFCLNYHHIFRTQIRAILRASAFGNVKIMFPMISCLEEVLKAREIIEEEKEKLRKKYSFDDNIEIGIMIEIPSAALIADTLAKEVDFFSIGTNDLVQYTLAVDRSNEKVAYLYRPTHPAILSLIWDVIKTAKRNGIWVSICGEMAGDALMLPILVGMGVDELSMSAPFIGSIRRIIRRLRLYEAEEIATQASQCQSAAEALRISEEFLYKIAPDIMSMILTGV